jgi:hypothetical protein
MASGVVTTMVCSLLSINLQAAPKDAAGCTDHPLIPRVAGYVITGCSEAPATFDADVQSGATTRTVHIEGKSRATLYAPDGAKRPTEAQLWRDFEGTITASGGTRVGETPGQKWPIYRIARDGKEYWVILMIDSGKYFTGSYAYRIVEK